LFFSDFVQRAPYSALFPLSVVADIYVDESKRRVWLVDFNPFGPVTDGLLFSWHEIFSAPTTTTPPPPNDDHGEEKRSSNPPVDFRIVDSEAEVRVSTANRSRYPVDATKAMYDTSTAADITKLVEMMQSGQLK